MSGIVEVTLGAEGLDYVRECLSIGKALSRTVLDTLDLESGVVTTFLPAGVPKEEIVRFSSGGKLQEQTVYVERNSQLMRFGQVETTDSTLISLIHEYLQSYPQAFCLLEDEMAHPNDAWLAELPATKLTDGQSLYYLLTLPDANGEAIERTFRSVASVSPPHVGFLGRAAVETMLNGGRLMPDDPAFAKIAAATDQILVGAYDRESFLRWRRSAPNGRRAS